MSQEEIVVPNGWSVKPLKDMCDFFVPMRDKPQEFGGNIPWLRIDEINAKFVDGNNAKFRVSEKTIKDMKLRVYPIGTVLCSCSATVGKCSITKEKLTTNQTFIGIFPKDKIFNEYLYYFLKSRIKELTNLGKGTTIAYISRKKFENLNIFFPELMKQKKLVAKLDHILGELEVKKKQIISLFEQNKQRIDFFEKNWFKFLILKEFEKFSKLPEWKLEKLMTVTTIGQGGTPSRSNLDYWNGDIPWLSSGEMRNNIITNSKEKITKLGLEKSSTKLCPIGTVMIAMTGQGLTRGRTSLLQIEACANQSCAHIIIQDQNNLLPEFLWFYLQSQYWKIRSVHHGSGQPGINTSTIKSWNIPLPPIQTQKEIVKNIKNAEEKFQTQKKQFENIKQNYDSKIKYINHIQSSVLDSAFSGKLLN